MDATAYTAKYREAARAARTATTFTEQGKFSRKADRILAAADRAGVRIDIAAVQREIEPRWERRTRIDGVDAFGRPAYVTEWVQV